MEASSSSSYLSSLNPAQLRAVQHPPSVPLQILAGPGSGKTKVLTSRIAHLILRYSLPPASICAVTFTNKTANEMRSRLQKLLGKDNVDQLKLGTFHSLCAEFLRTYAHTVGLANNFSICDADEAKRIIRHLLKKFAKLLADRDMFMKEALVMSKISKAKAKAITADKFAVEVGGKFSGPFETMAPQDMQEKITSEIYQEYEKLLRQNNALDFDDILLYGVKMFKQHAEAVAWCQHILVDEFQDTNTIQYELVRIIAHRSCLTIVGDPDQSIYGWRSAEVANLSKMKNDFPGTREVLLEENYRSTGAILRVSSAIIAEDKNRIQKSLFTSHPVGKTPTLRQCPTEIDEATFIAFEIKRLVACTGGLLQYEDFAILLRSNALSRGIESSLQKEGIPCRILGGHKFFERLEVKDLLAYLQLIDNPDFHPAFSRAVNTPSRGIGEKTLLEIASKAERCRTSHLAVLERIFDGNIPDIKPPMKRKISSFINTIRILRDLSQKRTSPADILRRLLRMIDYMEHLKKTQMDWEGRWANVEELINFATEVGADMQAAHSSDTPLRLFLQASSLSSEGDNDGKNISKVTIATCHAAKGLEWPVVMIPSVEEGTFPFSRTEDVEEERRLLYVACTRAKGLLYLTHTRRRKVAGQQKDVDRSSFVDDVFHKYPSILTHQCPEFGTDDRTVLSSILQRQAPDEEEVARALAKFNEETRHREDLENISELSELSDKRPQSEPPDLSRAAPYTSAFGPWNPSAASCLQVANGTPIRNLFNGQSVKMTAASTSRTLDGSSKAVSKTISTDIHLLASSDSPWAAQAPRDSINDLAARAPSNSSYPAPTGINQRLPLHRGPPPPSHNVNQMESSSFIPALNTGPLQVTNGRTPGQQIALSHHEVKPGDMRQGEMQSDKHGQVRLAHVAKSTTPLPGSSQSMTELDKQSGKRRLGMGRVSCGYANKKFKLPC